MQPEHASAQGRRDVKFWLTLGLLILITKPVSKFLLATDLDDTLVGDDQSLEELNRYLTHHREAHGTLIAYITGRSLEDYKTALRAKRPLLDPDVLVPSVGTEIYYDGSKTPDPVWEKQLSQDWDHDLIISLFANIDELTTQPESDQRTFKISYYLEERFAPQVLPHMETLLQEQGLAAKVVYSSGINLDILPANGDKGHAMYFLRQKFGFDHTETVVCGDSGNDCALFAHGDEKGILVGNAKTELLEWHRRNPSDSHYLAKAHFAGGILEGLQHFGFLNSD